MVKNSHSIILPPSGSAPCINTLPRIANPEAPFTYNVNVALQTVVVSFGCSGVWQSLG